MVQPGLNYNQCVECQQTFHPHIPNYFPRLLDCSHNICTQCLTPMIRDLIRLRGSDLSRPFTASNITCRVCTYKSRITGDNIDRFRVNHELMKYIAPRDPNGELQPGCVHTIRFEKFCCRMMFCSSCMVIHTQMHEVQKVEKSLETLHEKVTDDVSNLRFVSHRGLNDLDQHYHKLMQSLTNQYETVSDRFKTKSTKLKHRFERQLVAIQTEREMINDRLRIMDSSHLSKSIRDSDCLINKTYQQYNRYEIDKLNVGVDEFKDVKVRGRPNNSLPPIERLNISRENLIHSVEGALHPIPNSVSQIHLNRTESPIYDTRPIMTPQHGRVPALSPLPGQHTPHPRILPPTYSGGHIVTTPVRSQLSPLLAPNPRRRNLY